MTRRDLDDCLCALRAGGVVAYPTEAVYGLGCDPRNRRAFDRLFAIKQRPATQGVLLIAADFAPDHGARRSSRHRFHIGEKGGNAKLELRGGAAIALCGARCYKLVARTRRVPISARFYGRQNSHPGNQKPDRSA